MSFRLGTIPTEHPEQDQEVATIVARLVTRAVRVAERHDPADVAVLLCDAHQIAARLPVFDSRLCDAVAGQLSTLPPRSADLAERRKERHLRLGELRCRVERLEQEFGLTGPRLAAVADVPEPAPERPAAAVVPFARPAPVD